MAFIGSSKIGSLPGMINKEVGGATRNVLEGDWKSSKMLATMVGRRRGFWDTERLKRYISDSFHWDFTYSSPSFLAAGLFYIP